MIFDKLFKRKNKANKEITSAQAPSDPKDISAFMKDIASILNVDIPEITFVDCLYESNYVNGKFQKERMVQAHIELKEEELPDDISYLGAYYFDDKNLFIISNTYPEPNGLTKDFTYIRLSPPEHLFTIAHELRHVWQKKYHTDEYYEKNAVGMEIIHDPSEIDADAFALAYIFSDKTPFTAANLPVHVREMKIQSSMDGGKRWKRAEELAADYGFNTRDKLLAARG